MPKHVPPLVILSRDFDDAHRRDPKGHPIEILAVPLDVDKAKVVLKELRKKHPKAAIVGTDEIAAELWRDFQDLKEGRITAARTIRRSGFDNSRRSARASNWTPAQPSFSRAGGPKRLALALRTNRHRAQAGTIRNPPLVYHFNVISLKSDMAPTRPPSGWAVELSDEFDAEFDKLPDDVQDGLLAAAKAVRLAGPKAGRPHVDTLKGSIET
jgi:hypothetical protein